MNRYYFIYSISALLYTILCNAIEFTVTLDRLDGSIHKQESITRVKLAKASNYVPGVKSSKQIDSQHRVLS